MSGDAIVVSDVGKAPMRCQVGTSRAAAGTGLSPALIAVSAASNRSKADQDPSTWLPPAVGYRCTYVTDWVVDKTRWGLSVDAGEQAALAEVLGSCPDVPVTVTRAR
ncbi:hypothetical protein [Streptomyces sp. NPDC001851]|uniref:hypothetical protein n=1 Tax=Streptomyces sp. NPDC001851 TaxID=3154529 RepID=UPI00332C71D0